MLFLECLVSFHSSSKWDSGQSEYWEEVTHRQTWKKMRTACSKMSGNPLLVLRSCHYHTTEYSESVTTSPVWKRGTPTAECGSVLCLQASLLLVLYNNHPWEGKSWCSSLLCLKGFKIPIFLLVGEGVPQWSKCSRGWGGEAWCIPSAVKELNKEFQVQWCGQSEGIWFLSQTVKTLSGFTWVLLFVSPVH